MAPVIPILQVVTAIFAFVELGVSAYILHPFTAGGYGHETPAVRIAFVLFSSIWTLLVLAYVGLAPRFSPGAFHRKGALILVWLTALFWLGGAIAYTVTWAHLADFDCSYIIGGRYCNNVRAAAAFAFINLALSLANAGLETKQYRSDSRITRSSAV